MCDRDWIFYRCNQHSFRCQAQLRQDVPHPDLSREIFTATKIEGKPLEKSYQHIYFIFVVTKIIIIIIIGISNSISVHYISTYLILVNSRWKHASASCVWPPSWWPTSQTGPRTRRKMQGGSSIASCLICSTQTNRLVRARQKQQIKSLSR